MSFQVPIFCLLRGCIFTMDQAAALYTVCQHQVALVRRSVRSLQFSFVFFSTHQHPVSSIWTAVFTSGKFIFIDYWKSGLRCWVVKFDPRYHIDLRVVKTSLWPLQPLTGRSTTVGGPLPYFHSKTSLLVNIGIEFQCLMDIVYVFV